MKTISLLSIIVCTAALAACSSDTDGNTSGGGGEGGGLTTANPSTNSVGSGTGGEGGGTGGTGGTGDSSSSTGDTSSSSSGGDEDCSTAATPQACGECEAQKNPEGAQKFVTGLGTHCLCVEGTPCFDTCNGTAACAAGGTDATACQACLGGLQADPANPDQCIKDFVAECQPDAACKDFLLAQNACQSAAP